MAFACRTPHEQIFRAQDGILARTLWWDEDDDVVTAPDIRPAFKGNGGNGGSVGSDMGWQIRRDRSDARHSLRLFVRETMALANFFAKEHPRGKVSHAMHFACNTEELRYR